MNLNRDFPEIVEILGKRGLRQVLVSVKQSGFVYYVHTLH